MGTAALMAFASPVVGTTVARDEPSGAGTSMMLVMDASGSMAEPTGGGGTRIAAAKDGLNAVIDSLPADQLVGFRVFGASDVAEDDPKACTDSQRVVDLGTDNRDDLRDAVDAYEPVGWTPTSHALQQAAKDLGGEGQRTIVLVSDGEPTCDPDPCEVAGEIAKSGVDVRIDVVGFDVSGRARTTLQCVAERGNGTYYDADDAASLNSALTTSSTRAARPFDLTGTPVTGSYPPETAPELSTGQYLDTLREVPGASLTDPNAKTYYRLQRTAPGSTFHTGIALRGRPGRAVASVVMSTKYAEGGRWWNCNADSSFGVDLQSRVPIYHGGTTSWNADPESACNRGDTIALGLEPSAGDLDGQPVEIAVYEEPPITSPITAADVPAEPTWRPVAATTPTPDVVPGTSLANAPVVEPGTYALDISAGETQVVAVPVGWGQGLRAQLDATLDPGVLDAAGIGSDLTVAVMGPMRTDETVSLYGKEPDDWTTTAFGNLEGGTAYRTGAMSWPVHPANRAVNATVQSRASVAGLRYLTISLKARGDQANQPYTLSIARDDVVPDAAPTYEEVDGLTAPAADSRLVDSPVAAPSESATTAPTDTGEAANAVPWTWIAVGAAVVLALGLGGAAVLIRRAGRASGR